jgi:hypothetical protein
MSRARILADYVSSGDELADKAPLASPAFTGTPTGITAAHLEAGVLPAGVTGGSGLDVLSASNLSAGTVPDARFPAALPAIDGSALTGNVGKVLQVLSFVNNSTTSSTAATLNHFDATITPKSNTSKFLIQCNMKASHTDSVSLYFKIGIDNNFDLASRGNSYPSATGSIYMEGYGNSHSSNAQIDQYLGDYMYQHNSANTFSLKITHVLQAGTMYLNKAYNYDDSARGRPQSTLTVMEIGA